ncbi:nucleic-acid-binding protein from transposon X-element [Trichonephila clavipes]|nr:nucleic-acid-binding protein from transposon X-element [Trichonephila clavipes]
MASGTLGIWLAKRASIPYPKNIRGTTVGCILLACRKQLIGRANRCSNFLGGADFCVHGGELKGSSLIGAWREMKSTLIGCSSLSKRKLRLKGRGKPGWKLLDFFRVAVEPLNKSTMPPQCYRCQEFFHHSRFCARAPKCLKCSGGHLASDCTKSAKAPAKCANCSGPHPANFSGCPRNPINTKTNKSKSTKNVWQERAAARKDNKKQPTTPSFAEVVKKRHKQQLSGCQRSHESNGPDDVEVGTNAVHIRN